MAVPIDWYWQYSLILTMMYIPRPSLYRQTVSPGENHKYPDRHSVVHVVDEGLFLYYESRVWDVPDFYVTLVHSVD